MKNISHNPSSKNSNKNKSPISDNPNSFNQGIPSDPRVTHGSNDSTLCLQNAPQFALERLFEYAPTIIPHVFFNSQLKAILIWRLVSKQCYAAATFITTNCGHSPLASRANICFNSSSFHPKIDPLKYNKLEFTNTHIEKHNKFEFARARTHVTAKISFNDLVHALSRHNSQSILHDIDQNRLSIALAIESFDSLNNLQELLLSRPDTNFFDKIIELNLEKIDIDVNSIDAIHALFKNLSLFPCLTALSLGAIITGNSFEFPPFLSLTRFSVFGMRTASKISFFGFPNLKEFSVGPMLGRSQINFCCELPNLKKFFVHGMGASSSINFPKSLPSLIKFSMGWMTNTTFTLPNSINLKMLSIESISRNGARPVVLKLPDALPNLKKLFLGKVDPGAIIMMPNSAPKLKDIHNENGIVNNHRDLNQNESHHEYATQEGIACEMLTALLNVNDPLLAILLLITLVIGL